MAGVRMVQMSVDEVIGVIAMRDGLMSASRPVDVAGLVAAALMSAGASIWIRGRNFDAVLLGTITVHMFKMAIVQVVGMPLVAHSSVAATRAVAVRLMRVFLCGGHVVPLSNSPAAAQDASGHPVNVFGSGLFRREAGSGRNLLLTYIGRIGDTESD